MFCKPTSHIALQYQGTHTQMVEVENSASNRTDGDSHSAAEIVVGTADSHREAQTCHVGGRFHGVTFNNLSTTLLKHVKIMPKLAVQSRKPPAFQGFPRHSAQPTSASWLCQL